MIEDTVFPNLLSMSDSTGDFRDIKEEHVENADVLSHRLVRRSVFSKQKNIDDFINAIKTDRQHTIIINIDTPRSMDISHLSKLYLTRYIQDKTGANVYISVPDDYKYLTQTESMHSIQNYTEQNIIDILTIGFDPSKTRIIIDTADANILYPISVKLARLIESSQIDNISELNIGEIYQTSITCSKYILPQLIYGTHPTLVIGDLDEHKQVSLTNSLIDELEYNIQNVSGLFAYNLPSLDNAHKSMKNADHNNSINLSDSMDVIDTKISNHSYGENSGGNLDLSFPYLLLYYLFEEDDEKIVDIYNDCNSEQMTNSQLTEYAVEKVQKIISEHQAKREITDFDQLSNFRLSKTEHQSALTRIGFSINTGLY